AEAGAVGRDEGKLRDPSERGCDVSGLSIREHGRVADVEAFTRDAHDLHELAVLAGQLIEPGSDGRLDRHRHARRVLAAAGELDQEERMPGRTFDGCSDVA